jgi:dihydroflavonol-4-reductase
MNDLPRLQGPVAVTGASGYIASWVVKYLLEAGVTVHGTVRDKSREDKVGHLETSAEELPGTLTLFEADLMKPGSFDAAFEGCRIVFHMASPFVVQGVKDPQKELIDPAVEGTRNVLGSVEKTETVERVVLTSSAGAVYGDVAEIEKLPAGEAFDERHWNETSNLERSPYSYSKTLAEREAWKLAEAQDRWRLVTLNPTFVAGPSLSARTDSTSIDTVLSMVNGLFRFGVPDLGFGVVDVRDVALAHLRAASLPEAEGRHVLCNQVLSLLEIGQILRAEFGNKYPFPRRTVPKFVLMLVGPFMGYSREFLDSNIGYRIRFDATKSREALGLEYRSARSTFVDHLRQLEAMGLTP